METRIGKWGNSLALRIPQSIAAQMGLTVNSTVELAPADDRLVVTVLKSSVYELDDLLAGITEGNLHSEVDTGPASGREQW